MRFFKGKLLSFLLVITVVLSVMPVTAFATGEAITVSTEQDLRDAIDAIPEGGSGEITIQNIYMYLNEGLYIENKDITFNLVDAALVTAADEDGYGQPAIFGFGTNLVINMDNSSMQSEGHTGNMGVVRVDNSTDWDPETETFEKTFTLTINGGRFTCVAPDGYEEADSVIAAASGTKVVLTDVVCNGDVKAIAFEGVGITVPGELIINRGKFTNDVREYAATGKYGCKYGENYYIRDKEMTDDFSKPLTNGKVIFNYAKPSADDEAIWLISEDFCMENPDFYFDTEKFNDDFTKLELGIHYGTSKEEFHTVDVIWNYDAEVLQSAQTFIDKFPKDKPWFDVTDLELVNYWVNRNSEATTDTLANYSGELKSILRNLNFLYNVEVRGGGGGIFSTECIGSAKLIYDNTVYFASSMIGARAEHAIYVPESTANTKKALMAAAQKRIDDYIGKNVVKITAADETVTDYYNNTLADYDKDIADAQALLDAEMAKPENERDMFVVFDCQSIIDYTPNYKKYFMDSFKEGGDLHFLKKAAGDFFFNVQVAGLDDTYKFIIVKDDEKLGIPTYTTVDMDTNISVNTDSAKIPLDTVVEVNKLTKGDEYERIISILNVGENETFDIKLHSGSLNEYITTLEDDMFEVRIPIPKKFKGKDLIVYYVDENDKPIDYDVTIKGDFAYFVTNHFSIYTLAEYTGDHTHTGGTATCCAKAICTKCDKPYGKLNAENHSGGTEVRDAKEATENEKGYTGDTYCKGCGEKIADGKDIPVTGSGASTQTGDNSNIWLWISLLFVSGGCMLGFFIIKKRKERMASKLIF